MAEESDTRDLVAEAATAPSGAARLHLNSSENAQDGSTFKPLYVERNPTVYGIMESEMEHLTAWNVISSACFSIGSFFLSLLISLNIEFVDSDPLTTGNMALLLYGKVAAGVFWLVTWVLGIAFWKKRGGEIDRIKRECDLSKT
ncbi:hypothetical protein [Kordiimonas sp.]|uniref:hypothetical protein n=1 Tax=Kordiimonas sp. TaxID=1970157 RepID=UPI003A946678